MHVECGGWAAGERPEPAARGCACGSIHPCPGPPSAPARAPGGARGGVGVAQRAARVPAGAGAGGAKGAGATLRKHAGGGPDGHAALVAQVAPVLGARYRGLDALDAAGDAGQRLRPEGAGQREGAGVKGEPGAGRRAGCRAPARGLAAAPLPIESGGFDAPAPPGRPPGTGPAARAAPNTRACADKRPPPRGPPPANPRRHTARWRGKGALYLAGVRDCAKRAGSHAQGQGDGQEVQESHGNRLRRCRAGIRRHWGATRSPHSSQAAAPASRAASAAGGTCGRGGSPTRWAPC